MTYSSWSVVDIWHCQGLDCWDQNIRRDWADCDCVLAATQQLVVASNSSCAPPASLLSASTDHQQPGPSPSPHWRTAKIKHHFIPVCKMTCTVLNVNSFLSPTQIFTMLGVTVRVYNVATQVFQHWRSQSCSRSTRKPAQPAAQENMMEHNFREGRVQILFGQFCGMMFIQKGGGRGPR